MRHNGRFLSTYIPPAVIRKAKAIRAERDLQYGNIYEELDSDCRWVGEIGEIAFLRWLRKRCNVEVEWIVEDAAGKPDFVVDGVTVGAKTVKRQVSARIDYTAQVTARHVDEPVSQFFFMSYDQPKNRLELCGGISRQVFREEATYFGPGDRVHAHYRIREGHEIYNIPIGNLYDAKNWIKSLR